MRVARFILSFGMFHRASLKLILLHLALVNSLLRTIVNRSSFTVARVDGDVLTRSRHWYIRPISSGVRARSRGTTFAILGGRTSSAEFLTFCLHSMAHR